MSVDVKNGSFGPETPVLYHPWSRTSSNEVIPVLR